MHTPPAMLVASADSTAVAEAAAAKIADLPSKESRRSYECVWRYYLAWLAERELDVTAVRPKHIQLYLAKLRDVGLAKGSIARALTVIRSIYGVIVINELMPTNPAREVKGPKIDGNPKAPYIRNAVDIEKLINVHEANDSWFARRDRLIVRMALGLGWRRAEVARVTVEDFDGDAVTVLRQGRNAQDVRLARLPRRRNF